MKTVAKIIEAFGGLNWLRQPGNFAGRAHKWPNRSLTSRT
jgi:hypothetical protein